MKFFLIALVFALFALTLTGKGYAWDPENFKKPSREELKKKLSPLQFEITQEEGTEPPFKNLYDKEKREGIYVDIVSGEPLFSSKDKYDSGTGWPSFTRPLVKGNIVEKEDKGLFSTRTEIRSKHADSHLGHVFTDGPAPTGLRYCMNSAALRFIPKEDLKKEGYGEFLPLFAGSEGKSAKAVFAGGCFWCLEPPFEKLKGVKDVRPGYSGGKEKNPTYKEVSAGKTGHLEVVEVTYDPFQVSYRDLLEVYWRNVDPFDAIGQFCDKGTQYRSAVFYPEGKKAEAEASLAEKEKKLGKKVATLLLPESDFYPAEDYHQDYYKKNPVRYKFYRFNCGRDSRLKEVWE